VVVLTNAVEGQAAGFNEWCNIPDMLKVPGFASAQRLRLAAVQQKDMTYGYLD
jgi:hypothetical protein